MTGMELLSSPIDAADSGPHFGEQFEQVATRFCAFSLFAVEFVQIASDEATYGGVLFNSNSPHFL
jgi:hypothetical protein